MTDRLNAQWARRMGEALIRAADQLDAEEVRRAGEAPVDAPEPLEGYEAGYLDGHRAAVAGTAETPPTDAGDDYRLGWAEGYDSARPLPCGFLDPQARMSPP